MDIEEKAYTGFAVGMVNIAMGEAEDQARLGAVGSQSFRGVGPAEIDWLSCISDDC
jgi:hypothetical protein